MSESDWQRWNARYLAREGQFLDRDPDPFLLRMADRLPKVGRALDIAGGDGRNGVWLAQRGLTVMLADIAPAALQLARSRAELADVALATVEIDLEVDPPPHGPWDLIVCIAYLHRPLLARLRAELGPAGLLLVVHPTIRNLERFARPGESYLLGEGELVRLLQGWDIIYQEEGWHSDPGGRHEARCLVRKPADSGEG